MVAMAEKLKKAFRAFIPYVPAVVCFVASLFGEKVTAALLVMTGVVCLTAVVCVQQRRETRDQDDWIACLNVKRHDWLNHIQVIKGYLTLKKHDRLQPYLEHIMSAIEQESKICHLGYSPLSRYLLTRQLLNDSILHVHIVEGLKIANDGQGERLMKTIQEVESFVRNVYAKIPEPQAKIEMTLAPFEGGIMLYIDFPDHFRLRRALREADWTGLRNKVSSRNGEVFFHKGDLAAACSVRIV